MTMTISEDLVETLAALSGFTIAPAHRPGVAANLALLLDRAALIATPPLDPAIEPAPAFQP